MFFLISHLVHVAARSNLVTAFCCLQEVNQLAVDVHLVTMIMRRGREMVYSQRIQTINDVADFIESEAHVTKNDLFQDKPP